MAENSFESFSKVPLRTEDFLNPKRVALVMWDMQKGLAGRAVEIEKVSKAAKTLILAADNAEIPVIWTCDILLNLKDLHSRRIATSGRSFFARPGEKRPA